MTDQFIHQIFKERYQIQSLLGRQAGRRTFLAKDLNTQSQVVVKLLLFNPDFTWDDLKLFQREAETLRNLNHPAIPQYLDYFEVETEIGKGSALVQSYIEAKSLQDWAESGRSFSEAELKAISIQLLEVLQYLHSRQPPVIHRDIKPSNILLIDRSGNSLGTVYLVDFGSVQTVVQSGTITVVGTYGYMPPEQFGGKTTPASDLYALGATLIYLITRSHPANLPTRRGRIQFEVNSHISKRFQAWIKCLIQPDVEQRFNTAEKALETLQNDALLLDGFSSINSKPRGSQIILTKIDEKLHITIPPILIQKKLEAILETIVSTLSMCLLLLMFKVNPIMGWLTFCLLVWGISRMWISTIYTCFAEIKLLVYNQSITYTVRRGFGQFQKVSSSVQDVSRLTKSYIHIGSPPIEYPALSIWIGNHYCPLSFSSSSRHLPKLTHLEVEWLAFELSDWLDLPIQETDRKTQPNKGDRSNDQLMPENISKNSNNNFVNSSNLSKIRRPSKTKCAIKTSFGLIEVFAPSQQNYGYSGCLVLLAILGLLTVPLFFPFVVIFGIMLAIYRKNNPKNIILQIDKNIARLYELNQPNKSLKQIDRKYIRDIQVVYRSSQKYNSSHYHVQLRTHCSSDQLLVGNREHWLSEHEAYWIADKLSDWLKVPITEEEVSWSNETP